MAVTASQDVAATALSTLTFVPDADDNGTVELTDAVNIFLYLFSGGDAPKPPAPSAIENYPASDCGTDPTPDIQVPPLPKDDLGCVETGAICQ